MGHYEFFGGFPGAGNSLTVLHWGKVIHFTFLVLLKGAPVCPKIYSLIPKVWGEGAGSFSRQKNSACGFQRGGLAWPWLCLGAWQALAPMPLLTGGAALGASQLDTALRKDHHGPTAEKQHHL